MKQIRFWLAAIAVLLGCQVVNAATFDDWTSTNTAHSSTSSKTYTFTAEDGDFLFFDWSVSSEANYDKLIVTLDGTTILEKSGSYNGSYSKPLSGGDHTLIVKYTKDGSGNSGSDQVKVFNIVIAEPIIFNGIKYMLSSNRAAVVGVSEGINGTLVISGVLTLDGVDYGVTSIAESAFANCSNLTSITIPNSVVDIGNAAFKRCTGLKKVIFEDGEEAISLGYNASSQGLFYDCPLETVYVGRTLSYSSSSSYGYSPFYNKTSITSLTIGDKVASIGSYAFYGCSQITSLIIPNSVISIGSYSFYNCPITSLVLGERVKSIGGYSFYDCNLKYLVLPDSVTSIGDYAFYMSGISYLVNCSKLSISRDFTNGYVGAYANLGIIDAENYIIMNNFLFCTINGVHSLVGYIGPDIDIVLPVSYNGESYCIGAFAFHRSGITSVVMSDKITSVGEYAFEQCDALTCLKMSEKITSIGNSAFCGCKELSSIIIPKNVTSIGSDAFGGCLNIKEVIIEDGEGVLSMGGSGGTIARGLFYDCPLETLYWGRTLSYSYSTGVSPFSSKSTLISVTIGDSVTSMGESALNGCSALSSIVIPGCVTNIGNFAFNGCSSLTEVVMEDGEETLSLGYNSKVDTGTGKGMFYDCPLETLYLGRTLSYSNTSYYGYSPFYNRVNLTSVVVGDWVTKIGNYLFYGCKKVTSIEIPDGVASIGNYAFYGCDKLPSITIPNNVTGVGTYAFYGCANLTELTIGSSVSSIGTYAFAGCNEIENIYALNPKAITCDVNIFTTDVYNNATLYVPEGREQAYAKATPWSKFYIKTITTPAKGHEVNISSAGYATLYLDYTVERPRGVEAYYISRVAGDVAVLKALWDYIPANTGVILRGAMGTYTFVATNENVATISDNLLRGTTEDEEILAQKNTIYYALGRVDGVVGLYRAELENGYFFNNANKAYLALTSEVEGDDEGGQLSRGFALRFPDGSTTSIAELMKSDASEVEVIYDMQGRRLTEITEHGVYIVNGKKVWR